MGLDIDKLSLKVEASSDNAEKVSGQTFRA